MTTKFDIIKLKSRVAIGDVEAMYILAGDYLYGIGVDVDIVKAHSLLKKAADKGFEPARGIMKSVFADKGLSTEIEPKFKKEGYEMVKAMCQAADKGDPAALHLKSFGKLSDETDDFRFYRAVKDQEQACQKGYVPAPHSLGKVYYRGNRIKGKQQKGLSMILQAAQQEFIPALQYLMGISPESAFDILERMSKKEDADGEVYSMLSRFYLNGVKVDKDEQKGLELIEKAADKGDTDAIHDLAIIYEFGQYGVEKDLLKSIAYLEKGVELEDAQCMNDLAWVLEKSEDYPHDYNRAFELYKKAAEKGNAMAYNNLGTCYKRGIGTEVDAQKALECYQEAIELGEKNSSYWNLYLYYMDEVCTPRDFVKAVEWLEKGDDAGVGQCTYQLTKHYMNGDGVEEDAYKLFFYMNKAASMGFEEAFLKLADCYRYGVGTEKDGRRAFEWYQKAAEVSVEGIADLGQCYTYGIGTPQDYKKAAELYRIAAEQGNAQAQCDLGICYRSGEGVEKDPLKAIEWYLKAAEQEHGGALNNLGIMYQHGIGVEADPERAFGYYKRAAEAGNADGQFCVGLMYLNGHGVEQDEAEGVRWFKEAARQGEPDSMFHLAACYNEGRGVERDVTAVAYYLYCAADRGFQPAIDAINKNRIPRPESPK